MAGTPRQIEVLVPVNDPDAETIIEALNFKGKGCDIATKDIERALGTVQSKKHKPEYNKKEQAKRNVELG